MTVVAVKPRLAAMFVLMLVLAGLSACSIHHPALRGIHKIRHVVIIMQENRSFDSYFGTYPGADGIPVKNGHFTVCVPDPRTRGCDRPYHDPSLVNGGAGHDRGDAITDVDGGKMDGFVRSAELAISRGCSATHPPPAVCLPKGPPDVMGYHDAREIPNYWAYARHYALDDHMFEPVASWSLPSHLYLVSGWSAHCKNADPFSCRNDPGQQVAHRLPHVFLRCLRTYGVRLVRLHRSAELKPRERGGRRVPRSAQPAAAGAGARQGRWRRRRRG
jgi:phospholipase C